MTSDSTSLTLETAQNLLEQFTRIEIQSQTLPKDLDEIRQALVLLAQHSDYQMIGICAESLPEALTALSAYLTKLGYNIEIDSNRINPIKGAVYLKFNGRNQSYYASAYNEKYRGVLVAYQSSDEARINGTYGHFPLDLF
ncbi:MAG: DUF1824 family protein [Microcoleaceae cyanobacterium]